MFLSLLMDSALMWLILSTLVMTQMHALSGLLRRRRQPPSHANVYEQFSKLNISFSHASNALMDIDASDLNALSDEIERIIKQTNSDQKVRNLLKLTSMIECEISRIKYSPFAFKQWSIDQETNEKIQVLKLNLHLDRIQRHHDETVNWMETHYDQPHSFHRINGFHRKNDKISRNQMYLRV